MISLLGITAGIAAWDDTRDGRTKTASAIDWGRDVGVCGAGGRGGKKP
jgi:hypothetical protein